MIAIRTASIVPVRASPRYAPPDEWGEPVSRDSGLYAAYGSNMDPEQMLERCPHSPGAGTGWLPGWRLTFGGEDMGWDGALPMVVPDKDGQVFVALYEV